MQGLLADANLEGLLPHLRGILERSDLWPILVELRIVFATFDDLAMPRDTNDRELWIRCQQQGWVLLTDNRNADHEDSLESALVELWRIGHLPVITIGSKDDFQRDAHYAEIVARDVADLLFGIATENDYCDEPRVYVPRFSPW